jgi:hypothetical protein
MIIADRWLHVFHWPTGYPIRLLLPAMILLSLVLHVAGLYLVRATVPAHGVALPPLPGKIAIIPVADAGLIAARDPSWLQPGRFRHALLPAPKVERPWRALQPALPPLVAAPEEVLPETWVPALPPLSVQARFEPRGPAGPAPVLEPVRARFDGPGPEVTEDVLGRLRAAAPPQPPGQPTELLVVLDAAGGARHVWLVRGSGDAALDAAAARAVQLSRFGPSDGGYRGMLRVVWGAGGTAP